MIVAVIYNRCHEMHRQQAAMRPLVVRYNAGGYVQHNVRVYDIYVLQHKKKWHFEYMVYMV
jgi:hypothetical protein